MKERYLIVGIIFILLFVLELINRYERFNIQNVRKSIKRIDNVLDKIIKKGDLSRSRIGTNVRRLSILNRDVYRNIATNIQQTLYSGRNLGAAGVSSIYALLDTFDLIKNIKNL
jgi:hypothetical protein